MAPLLIFFAILPILIIFLLLIVLKKPADIAGIAGWLASLAVACLCFNSDLTTMLTASFSGLIASFPVALAMAASIFQITLMAETGALTRIVAAIKTVSPQDRIVQLLLVNVAFATIAVSLGAVPVSILPPIMIALGYSTFTSIALPSVGYSGFCIYALLGTPAVIFAAFVDMPLAEMGINLAKFMPLTNALVALALLWLAGGARMFAAGFLPAVLSGVAGGLACMLMAKIGLVTIGGIGAGLGMALVLCLYLLLRGRAVSDQAMAAANAAEHELSLARAASPWILLVVVAVLTNMHQLPFFKILFTDWAMPVEIIPGRPEKLRLFWQAYFWIFVCTLACVPLIKAKPAHLASSWRKFLQRAPRPVLAAAVYFSVGYVYNHSAKNDLWVMTEPALNMVHLMADASVALFGKFYAGAAALTGLAAGFISGTQSSAIAMLTGLHLASAKSIGADAIAVATAGAIGAGLSSMISPAKLMNASASIDRIGEEGQVLRRCIIFALILTVFVAVQGYFLS